ncbi:hypothetical protein Hanom_Chr03g00231901 [Helianthus anomalus]
MLSTLEDLNSKGLFHLFTRSPNHLIFTFSTSNPSMCSIMNPAELWFTKP